MILNSSIFNWLKLPLLVLVCWLGTTAAPAHSHLQRVKFPLPASADQRARIDSAMRAQPGVFSAEWSPRSQILTVVYDRMVTNKHRLKRNVETINHWTASQPVSTHQQKEAVGTPQPLRDSARCR